MRTGALLPTMIMAMLASAVARGASDRVFERQVAADPRGVVEISNVAGRIKVSGWDRVEHGAGELEATAVSGGVTLRLDSARSVRVRTTSGDLRFEGKLLRGASFDAESVSGELIVRASAEAGYEYEVTTFSGDIRDCFNVEAERASKYGPGHRLSGTRAEGGAHVRLKTMSGSVELCDR